MYTSEARRTKMHISICMRIHVLVCIRIRRLEMRDLLGIWRMVCFQPQVFQPGRSRDARWWPDKEQLVDGTIHLDDHSQSKAMKQILGPSLYQTWLSNHMSSFISNMLSFSLRLVARSPIKLISQHISSIGSSQLLLAKTKACHSSCRRRKLLMK